MADIPTSTIRLSYPLYACDFDPQDPNRLVVAGGGGSSRSGVGNKISVLDTSKADELRLAGELDLSSNEDNVTTLAFGQTKGKTSALYAGVNSSPNDVAKGKNEHLRTFSLDASSLSASARKGSTGSSLVASLRSPKVTEVARTALFTTKDKDAYQRLLRLPPPPTAGVTTIGAAASAFAPDPEISLFETSSSSASSSSGFSAGVQPRGHLTLDREAMDLDVIQTNDNSYQLAHCDDHNLFLFTVAKANSASAATLSTPASSGPECVYTIPHGSSPNSPDPHNRPAFRSIRYLTSGFLLAVSNIPKRRGVVLQGLRLPPPPSTSGKDDDSDEEQEGTAPAVDDPSRKARLSVTRRLPSSVVQATGLAVRNINPQSAPGASAGDTQFVIAVAGHDASISLFTLDHTSSKFASNPANPSGGLDLLHNLLPFATLSSIHPTHITGLSFSVVHPAAAAAGVTPKKTTPVIRLASVSVGNTAVVHAIPLRTTPETSKPKTMGAKKLPAGIPRQMKYIVAVPPKKDRPIGLAVFTVVGVIILAVLGQILVEALGTSPWEVLGAREFLPERWVLPVPPQIVRRREAEAAERLAQGGHGEGGDPHSGFLGKLMKEIEGLGVDFHHHHQAGSKIILRDEATAPDVEGAEPPAEAKVKVQVIPASDGQDAGGEGGESQGKLWDELTTPDREAWKQKLKMSGHWVEDMGEAVFKGVLFGEIGGVVGNIMAAGAGMR